MRRAPGTLAQRPRGKPQFGARRVCEALGHDADHRGGQAQHADLAAQNVRIAAVDALPEAVAQDDGGEAFARPMLGRSEVPAPGGVNAEHIKKLLGDRRAGHLHRLAAASHEQRRLAVGGHAGEGVVLRAPIVEVGKGGAGLVPILQARDPGQAVRPGIGERIEQHRLDDAEEGCLDLIRSAASLTDSVPLYGSMT